MHVVVDMNMSVLWVGLLSANGHEAVHWSTVGNVDADDEIIMNWAVANKHVVLTNDIDFTTLLALTKSTGPSVVLIRGPRTLTRQIGATVCSFLLQFQSELTNGAILTIRSEVARARLLPLT